MAKKAKHPAPVQEVSPGKNPYEKSGNVGRRLGNLLGCACLLVFAVFEELWIGMAACTLCLGIIFGITVFHDKTAKWYTSPFLYAMLATAVLAYVEYAYQLLTNFMTLKR
jgi:hypothetical protein